MGTILARRRKHGGMAYMAKIILTHKGKTIHRESRTFETHKRASQWIKERETELARPGEIARVNAPTYTLADAIDRYTDESLKQIGRTKAQVLQSIKAYPIAGKPCAAIGSDDIVAFARDLNTAERQPQTVGNYLSHLGSVFTVARPAWGYELDSRAMDDALIVAKRLGLVEKSKQRDRRPTLDEINRIMEHFEERSIRTPDAAPMMHITAFAIFSTRRQEEITTLQWGNLEERHSRILVKDMKHPGQKQGNDVWTDLPAPALAIIQAMPDKDDRIFPFGTYGVSAAFTRACQFLKINDLHFHDLRHDGVSRLFEMGMNIPQAASVSGHRSWQSLKRYTHVRQQGDKYQDWPWLKIVTRPPHVDKRQRAPYAVSRAEETPPGRKLRLKPARRSRAS